MSRQRVVILFLLICLVLGAANAQEAVTGGPFVLELTEALAGRGWPADEVERFHASAVSLEWPEPGGARVEAVAFALSYYRDRAGVAATPADTALMAHELAGIVAVMHESGFRPVEIGRATVEGTRDALAEREQARLDSSVGPVGTAIREQVLVRVRDQIRDMATGRGPEVAREVMNRLGHLSSPAGFEGPPPHAPPGGPLE